MASHDKRKRVHPVENAPTIISPNENNQKPVDFQAEFIRRKGMVLPATAILIASLLFEGGRANV